MLIQGAIGGVFLAFIEGASFMLQKVFQARQEEEQARVLGMPLPSQTGLSALPSWLTPNDYRFEQDEDF